MKRWLVLIGVVVALAGGYLLAAHLSGGAFPTLGLPLGGDRGLVRRASLSFLEDIQFKDFDSAARYHSPEKQDTVDIPYLIQRLFQVKPEALDIMGYEIIFADLDSTETRARVKMRVKVKELTRGQIRDQELMLYFERKDERSPWYMKLEDSLRKLDADKDKKH